MYELKPAISFQRSLKRILKSNAPIIKKLNTTLELLRNDPSHPSLKSHKVATRKYGECWGSRVTGDIRIIWTYDGEDQLVILLLDIGNHSGTHKVYK